MNRFDMVDDATKLLKKARKQFYDGELNSEDVKQCFEVIPNARIEFTTNPQTLNTYYGDTWLNGEFKGNLDNKSKEVIKTTSSKNADLLVIRNGGIAYEVYLNGGFYSFNPHRRSPDKIVALKVR